MFVFAYGSEKEFFKATDSLLFIKEKKNNHNKAEVKDAPVPLPFLLLLSFVYWITRECMFYIKQTEK
jgi:hypothetical protein